MKLLALLTPRNGRPFAKDKHFRNSLTGGLLKEAAFVKCIEWVIQVLSARCAEHQQRRAYIRRGSVNSVNDTNAVGRIEDRLDELVQIKGERYLSPAEVDELKRIRQMLARAAAGQIIS